MACGCNSRLPYFIMSILIAKRVLRKPKKTSLIELFNQVPLVLRVSQGNFGNFILYSTGYQSNNTMCWEWGFVDNHTPTTIPNVISPRSAYSVAKSFILDNQIHTYQPSDVFIGEEYTLVVFDIMEIGADRYRL